MPVMWQPGEYEEAATRAIEVLGRYVERTQLGDGPALSRPPLSEVERDLDLRRLIREGGMTAADVDGFIEEYLERGNRKHHPGSLAHQVAVPDVPAAIADLVHGATNNPGSIYEMGASSATVEVAIVEWMLEKVGFDPERGAGILTHGGSLANLTAMLAARARVAPDAWTDGAPGDLAVLAPPSAHYSIARTAAMLGLGERAIVPLEVDELDRIRVDRLEDALERMRAEGRRPMMLVAASCATSTGLHDDLVGIGEFCRANGIWFHVDAAHGASALLSPRHKHLLNGLEDADSTIWDAHKMLRTSSLCAAVLLRDEAALVGAFHQEASYLFYGESRPDSFDVMSRQFECTKSQLGLKVFLNLAWRGERGLGEYVADRYDTTLRFWELIREREGFECPYRPESNILCFRYGTDSDAQVEIRERLMEEGRFHLSSAELNGERFLRVTVMAPSATEETAVDMLDAIERVAAAVGAPS
jgi:L-2,4-diaminobutyrate decarboxylase